MHKDYWHVHIFYKTTFLFRVVIFVLKIDERFLLVRKIEYFYILALFCTFCHKSVIFGATETNSCMQNDNWRAHFLNKTTLLFRAVISVLK